MRRLFPAPEPEHRYPRVTSARVLSALFNLAVAVRLLWPDDTLGGSPSYELADRHFLGDVGLATGLLLMGLLMAVSLYTDRVDHLAGTATLLALATWLLFAVDLALVNGSQIGTLVYGILAAGGHAYAFAHLLSYRDQRHRDKRAAEGSA